MGAETTHRAGLQLVSPERLRAILRSDGERCYCQLPDADVNEQWDVAGECPEHGEIWVKASGTPHPDDEDSE